MIRTKQINHISSNYRPLFKHINPGDTVEFIAKKENSTTRTIDNITNIYSNNNNRDDITLYFL